MGGNQTVLSATLTFLGAVIVLVLLGMLLGLGGGCPCGRS